MWPVVSDFFILHNGFKNKHLCSTFCQVILEFHGPLEAEFLGHTVTLLSTFWRTTKVSLQTDFILNFYQPCKKAPISPQHLYFLLIMLTILDLNQCFFVSPSLFVFFFIMDKVRQIFMCLLAVYIYSNIALH